MLIFMQAKCPACSESLAAMLKTETPAKVEMQRHETRAFLPGFRDSFFVRRKNE
jgi:hypothetical protein